MKGGGSPKNLTTAVLENPKMDGVICKPSLRAYSTQPHYQDTVGRGDCDGDGVARQATRPTVCVGMGDAK